MSMFFERQPRITSCMQENTRSNAQVGRRLTRMLWLLAVLVGLFAWNFPSFRETYRQGLFRTGFPNGRALNETEPHRNQRALEIPWVLDNATIPQNEIRSGGPPKDGIPALTRPKMIAAGEATYLSRGDRVIGVVIENEARAYPLAIMNHHEIVNDTIRTQSIAVTYCPLCDSTVVYDRAEGDLVREFGVSGLLYNSNVLMYDRRSHPPSLWSQIKAEGVTGPGASKSIIVLPVELTTWGEWRDRHPRSLVLSTDTGHRRDYRRNPYENYFQSPKLMFPVNEESKLLPNKAPILGIWTKNASKAYPISRFGDKSRTVEDSFDGHQVTLQFTAESSSIRVVKADDGIHWMYSFWFAWYAFHPETTIFQ